MSTKQFFTIDEKETAKVREEIRKIDGIIYGLSGVMAVIALWFSSSLLFLLFNNW